jgi:hypothetical protein
MQQNTNQHHNFATRESFRSLQSLLYRPATRRVRFWCLLFALFFRYCLRSIHHRALRGDASQSARLELLSVIVDLAVYFGTSLIP